jgi:exopolyphosphatase/guanosine-5'-triphosphate,3'-diphosphate pyrophosphatase
VLKSLDGGIIDIGGASTEITARFNGKVEYSKSVNIGGVRILDACLQDVEKITAFCQEKVKEFDAIPPVKYYGIGGTATSIASVLQKLEVYDTKKVHGYKLTKENVDEAVAIFASKTVEERKNIIGLQPGRADVILGATILLSVIMDKLALSEIFVSEDDNLEGYLYLKEVKDEQ